MPNPKDRTAKASLDLRRSKKGRVTSTAFTPQQFRRWIGGLFVLALVVRFLYLSYVLEFHSGPELLSLFPDSSRYLHIANYLFGYSPEGEKELVFSGPGYGGFLGALLHLLKCGPSVVLVIQALLSSLNCVLIASLAHSLFPHEPRLPLFAGLVAAASPTSAVLTVSFMSETLFVTLIAGSVLSFLKALEGAGIWAFVLSGISGAFAAFVRPVAQYWPWLMVIWLLGVYVFRKQQGLLYKGLIGVLASLILVSCWTYRNFHRHRISVFATVGIITGARYLATDVRATELGADLQALQMEFDRALKNSETTQDPIASGYHYARNFLLETFKAYPIQSLKQFLLIVGFNVVSNDILHSVQIPETEWGWVFGGLGLGLYIQVCSLVALLLLLAEKEFLAATMLGSLYFYFAVGGGVTYWTGSRVFFPAQISWAILLVLMHHRAGRLLARLLRR